MKKEILIGGVMGLILGLGLGGGIGQTQQTPIVQANEIVSRLEEPREPTVYEASSEMVGPGGTAEEMEVNVVVYGSIHLPKCPVLGKRRKP